MIQYQYTVTIDQQTWVFSNDNQYTQADIRTVLTETMGYVEPFDFVYTQVEVEV